MTQIYDLTRLEQTLIKHEGFRDKPYTDSNGVLTIGIGRAGAKLSFDEALYLCRNDIAKAFECASKHHFFWHLNKVRKEVIVEMIFNIGYSGFLKFEKMIEALGVHNYQKAAEELLDSTWAIQVGLLRSQSMANRLQTGKYEE